MSRHSRLDVLAAMKRTGVVPVFYHPDPGVAKKAAFACADGGAACVEFTNRGDGAIDVFIALCRSRDAERPELMLGVGSVCDAPTAAMYIAAGADFVVGPVLDEDVARLCNSRKIPYCPGCGSATEIHRAHILGVEICKVFPGEQVGGPGFVKSVRGPMPWAELMPTGGVAPERGSLEAWFKAGIACAGMGSNLVTREMLSVGDYAGIAGKVGETIAMIRDIRGVK